MSAMSAFGSFLTKLKMIFLKFRILLWKIFLILTSPAARKKFTTRIKARKKQKLLKELKVLIEGEITPKMLWYVYRTATKEEIEQKSFQLFLNHHNLFLNDIDDAAEDVSPEKKELILILWNKELEIGVSNERLLNIIKDGPHNFQDLAINELLTRIKGGKIRKPHAEEILRTIIDEIPSQRISMWQFLKTLKPSSEVLEKLLSSHWLYSLPKIEAEIKELIKEIRKQERKGTEGLEQTSKKVKKIIEQLQKLQ